MNTTIQKWGNSLALRIPKAFADQAKLAAGRRAVIEIDADTITIRPARHEWTLDELLKKITPANKPKLVDWGPAVGKEIW